MTDKKTPDVIIKPKVPEAPAHKMEVGAVATAPTSTNMDQLGAESQPFAPQITDLDEAVTFASPMELEAFMHDMIQIQTNPLSGMGINGERLDQIITFRARDKVQNVYLGGTQMVGRWCVELMCRCRDAFVRGEHETVQKSSDQHVYKNTTLMNTKTLKYMFSVIHDPAGAKGHRWREQVMRDRI